MRVVVTGGAGFVGRPTVRALAHGGHEVDVLDSLRPDVHTGDPPDLGAPLHRVDVRDTEAVAGHLAGVDAVVHLAAKVGLGVDVDDVEDYASSNDLGTACVLRAAHRADVRHIVFASSMVVYGEGAYDCADHGRVAPAPRRTTDLDAGSFEPPCPVCGLALAPGVVTEEAPTDPRNVYAATKLHGEHLLAAWARETGGAATSLRLHNVYGPGMPLDTPYAGVAALFLARLRAGEAPQVFEDGRQRRDFVHVDDVARAFRAALEQDDGRTYNIGSGTVTTVGQMAWALTGATGGPQPVVTGEYRLGDVRHVTASSRRARDELGWRADIALREGVRSL